MAKNKIDELTTQLMEHFCDNLCTHPKTVDNKDWLEDICAECKCGEIAIALLNEGLRLEREEGSNETKTDDKG